MKPYKGYALDFHKWRKLSASIDLLDLVIVAGFFTIIISKECIGDKLKKAADAIEENKRLRGERWSD
jgi:hypothetical protein